MQFCLRWPDGSESSFRLVDGEELIVGRDADESQFVLQEPSVSRRHCKLSAVGDKAWLEDLGSSGGSFVNGERVQIALLSPGDTIYLGRCEIVVSADPP